MNWWIARMKEKSTWLAVFTLASLVGVQIEPELKDRLIEAILAAAAVVAFIFKETDDAERKPTINLVSRPEFESQPADAERMRTATDLRTPSSRVARLREHDFTTGFNDQ